MAAPWRMCCTTSGGDEPACRSMMTCYDDAMRTIIDLPDEQVEALAELCARERISRAEAIRRAVAAMLATNKRKHRAEVLAETFGAWKHLGIDTDTYLAEIRSEWDRDWDR